MDNETKTTAAAPAADPSTLERIEGALSRGLAHANDVAKRDLMAAEHAALDEWRALAATMHEWIRRRMGSGPAARTVHLQTAGHQLDEMTRTVGVHYATQTILPKA